MRILIVGVGNPILGDDAVGIIVAKKLREKLTNINDEIDIIEFSGSPIKLAEMMLNYDRVIIIDCVKVENRKPGDIIIYDYNNEDILNFDYHAPSPHDIDFFSILKYFKESVPDMLPKEIRIIGINCPSNITFSEKLSEPIRNTINNIVDTILYDLIKR